MSMHREDWIAFGKKYWIEIAVVGVALLCFAYGYHLGGK